MVPDIFGKSHPARGVFFPNFRVGLRGAIVVNRRDPETSATGIRRAQANAAPDFAAGSRCHPGGVVISRLDTVR